MCGGLPFVWQCNVCLNTLSQKGLTISKKDIVFCQGVASWQTLQCYCSKHSLRAEISAVAGHISLYHHLFLQVAVPRPQLLPSHPRQLNFSPESLSDGCNCHRVPVSRCLVYYCERCVQCPVQNYWAGQARLGRTLLLRSAGPAAVMV